MIHDIWYMKYDTTYDIWFDGEWYMIYDMIDIMIWWYEIWYNIWYDMIYNYMMKYDESNPSEIKFISCTV